MAEKYLQQLSELMKGASTRKNKNIQLECKHFFSGAAVYTNGKICMSLSPVGFAIKLPEGHRNNLLKEKNAKTLRYFPGAPVKKEYVVFPKAMLKDKKALRFWMKLSLAYVLRMNKKPT